MHGQTKAPPAHARLPVTQKLCSIGRLFKARGFIFQIVCIRMRVGSKHFGFELGLRFLSCAGPIIPPVAGHNETPRHFIRMRILRNGRSFPIQCSTVVSDHREIQIGRSPTSPGVRRSRRSETFHLLKPSLLGVPAR